MVRIGIVGIGFMGRIHYLAARGLQGACVSAICSRDPAKLAGDWSGTRGNFGPEPGHVELTGVTPYDSFEKMLADPSIDLIDICTVTDQHAPLAIQALKAGKHVLVEKAIALSEEEADTMLEEARSAKKLLMVAHVLPFFPEFAFAADAVRSGKHGKLLAAHFTRVIAQPDWSTAISDAAKTGGPAVDLHIHDTHFIGLVAGLPEEVFATGIVENDAVTYLNAHYIYPDGGPRVTAASGAIARPGRSFMHGFEIYLEKATLAYSSHGVQLTLIDATSEIVNLPGSGDPLAAFTLELQAAVDGVKAGKEADLLSGTLARNALVLCHREIESVKTGLAVWV